MKLENVWQKEKEGFAALRFISMTFNCGYACVCFLLVFYTVAKL